MTPGFRGVGYFVWRLPEGSFFSEKIMAKISEYYLNKASYMAIDENGNRIDIDIDYWGGKFRVSQENPELEKYVSKLLKNKHRVNFAYKLNSEP